MSVTEFLAQLVVVDPHQFVAGKNQNHSGSARVEEQSQGELLTSKMKNVNICIHMWTIDNC